MKVIMLTNKLTPHQLPLSRAFLDDPQIDFTLFECVDINQNTLPVGWSQSGEFSFVVSYKELTADLERYIDLITDADVVITGSAPDFLIKKRLMLKKLTFRYSERVYKKSCPWYEIPLRAIKYYFSFGRYDNYYLLCASAYTSPDYARTRTFINKAYKWGYFPVLVHYDNIDSLISDKRPNTLLWVGRFIDWKHPEAPLEVAKRLKADGVDFELNMIGTGDMLDKIADIIRQNDLENTVHLLGSMSPEEVRHHMKKSTIYLFTSDRGEGWGAVLNESMNSACAVVSSHAIGSTPFLVNDGENGLIYKDGNIDDLYTKVKWLLSHDKERTTIAKNAYGTMITEWNAENAAKKLILLSERILSGEKSPDAFENGVCSKAEILKDDWYKNE